jgi:type IV secretion system protein TrbL
MRKTTRAAALLFFLALVPSAAFAQSAPACARPAGSGGILTGLASQFSTTTGPWTTTALGYAQDLFFALVAIEIAWSAITYVLQKDSLPDFLAALLLKIISVGFFYILLQPQYGPVWIADVIASFSQAGSAIGGQSQFGPTDPSSVFNCGTDIANAMLQSLSGNPVGLTFGNILPAIEACFAALICALGVVLAFAIIAGQLLITLIESYIVIGAGVFMLGFTGSRWTLVFGEKYVGYAFSVGIKLFMLELIIGLGYGLGQQWAALFGNGIAPPGTYIEVVGAALIFGFVSWQIPGLAASLMNGAPRMTLGSFLSTAGTVAVGGVVLGSGVAGMVAGGRALSTTGPNILRAAGDAGQSNDPLALNAGTTSSRRNGRGSDGVVDDLSPQAYSRRDGDRVAPHARRASDFDAEDLTDEPPSTSTVTSDHSDSLANSTSDASRQAHHAEDDDERHSASSGGQPDTTEAEVTAEEADQTRANDAALAAEDERFARQAEQRDVRGSSAGAASSAPHVDPTRALRQPPPDDSADGSIHIRFKHPE